MITSLFGKDFEVDMRSYVSGFDGSLRIFKDAQLFFSLSAFLSL